MDGDGVVSTTANVSVGSDDAESRLSVDCVTGGQCLTLNRGNLYIKGGAYWTGSGGDNAAILVDVSGTGWGGGNKIMRVIDRNGEETFALRHDGRMNWRPTRSNFSFCDVRTAREIPNSEGAMFCALTRVDDDSPSGYCRIFEIDDVWYYQTGGDCGANACGGMCLK